MFRKENYSYPSSWLNWLATVFIVKYGIKSGKMYKILSSYINKVYVFPTHTKRFIDYITFIKAIQMKRFTKTRVYPSNSTGLIEYVNHILQLTLQMKAYHSAAT